MGILLSSQYTLNTPLPLDDRDVVTNVTARNSIASGRRYEGMTVYVASEKTNYQLQGGVTNADWVEVGAGSSGGGPVTPGGGSVADIAGYTVDDIGNHSLTIRAILSFVVIQDPDGIKWALKATHEGELVIDDSTSADPTGLRLISDDGTTVVGLIVENEKIITVPDPGTGELIQLCYIVAPTGLAWRMSINVAGEVYLKDAEGNSWSLSDQLNQQVYKVQHTTGGVVHETRLSTSLPDSLPTTGQAAYAFVMENGKPRMKIQFPDGSWHGVAFQNEIVTDPFPVGMVMQSMLTRSEFLVEMNDPQGLRWKQLDGSSIPSDSRLAIIKGWKSVPNGKGLFFRGLDDLTGTVDPEVSLRSRHEGSLLGSYQGDGIPNHNHLVYNIRWGASCDDNPRDSNTFASELGCASVGRTNDLGGASGGSAPETRVKNLAGNYFIKYHK